MPDSSTLRLAATCIPVRTTALGTIEVLMVKRNASLSFGGMWTFPGGVLEESDGVLPEHAEHLTQGVMRWGEPTILSTAARAAARETHEETALHCNISSLAWFSHWIPPTVGPPKRFATWFFLAPEHRGELFVDTDENDEGRWLTPASALESCALGDFPLAVPTWITLDDLSDVEHLGTLVDSVVTRGARIHHTVGFPSSDGRGRVLCWGGDAAYETGIVDAPGPRNRVLATRDGMVIERIVR